MKGIGIHETSTPIPFFSFAIKTLERTAKSCERRRFSILTIQNDTIIL
jgi:hypothetical protein